MRAAVSASRFLSCPSDIRFKELVETPDLDPKSLKLVLSNEVLLLKDKKASALATSYIFGVCSFILHAPYFWAPFGLSLGYAFWTNWKHHKIYRAEKLIKD
jgi:hypothetical protein